MQTYLFTGQPITYNGRQLSPHWLYRQFDLLGDAIAAEVNDIWLARCKGCKSKNLF